VIGESRPFVSALAVLNAEEWQQLAGSLGLDAADAGVLASPQVQDAVLTRMAARLAAFPSYAQVRRAWLTLQPWTTDTGLITPTMKLRRRQLQERFAAEIEAIYQPRTPA
jgi:long-chain acyl-CoA synthetase